ncbi:MAG: helix-turn-helix transcriptional regulator [Lachnospiraceae bacterium]|nr:helix-turn-helix transcriptional regulator [Lachnospiraceae bacterium]
MSDNTIHYIGTIVVGLGFFCFYISRKIFPSISMRKVILMFFNVAYISGMIYTMFIPANLYITWIVLLSLGYLGGVVYYYIAVAIGRTRYVGRVAMIGQIFALLMQMLIPQNIDDTFILITILIIVFLLVTYLVLFPPADWMFEEILPYAKETPMWNNEIRKRLTILLIIVFFADMFVCLVEITWTAKLENDIMYTFPRYFMIAGYALAGIFADYKKHKYLDTALLVVLGFSFSGIYMAEHTTERLCIYYILAGFTILYMNIKFWHLASYTKSPEIWASFGRIIYVFEGFISEFFIKTIRGSNFYCTIVLALFFAVVIYCILKESPLKAQGEWILFESDEALQSIESKEEATQKEFMNYASTYELTPRECDVLKCILNSDESMKIIAEQLGISERMLYRYMNQLYEKTGAENRAGLVKKYYESLI